MIDIESVYNDSSVVDASIFASWNGQTPLYSAILNSILSPDRLADRPPARDESFEDTVPRGRW